MSEPMPDFVLYRITIEMVLDENGDQTVNSKFEDLQEPDDGTMPPLVQMLGMIELTKDTAIRISMGEDPE
jgi:hypothetical protein